MAFAGRILLSLIFIASAVGKLFNWSSSNHYLSQGLSEWHGRVAAFPELVSVLDRLMVLSPFLLVIAVVLEVFGGLMVLLNMQARLGTLLLILFLVPTTVLMHPFWMAGAADHDVQMIMFMKNLSILGGLLIYLAYLNGSGRSSGKKKSKSSKSED